MLLGFTSSVRGNSINSLTEQPILHLSLHARKVYNGIICMDAHVQYMLHLRICCSSSALALEAKRLTCILGTLSREQYILWILVLNINLKAERRLCLVFLCPIVIVSEVNPEVFRDHFRGGLFLRALSLRTTAESFNWVSSL